MNCKDTSSKQQDKSPKSKSDRVSNSVTDDYKYIPGADRPNSSVKENMKSSSSNI